MQKFLIGVKSINNMARHNSETDNNARNLIAAGTLIEGNVKCNGDIRIEGTLIGNLIVKGKLVLGETGKIEGEIVCQNADISGHLLVTKMQVIELTKLQANAKFQGELLTNQLAIEPGAIFSGTCSMDKQISMPE